MLHERGLFMLIACKESNGQTKMPSEYEFKFTKSHKILFVKLYYKNFISAQEDWDILI